MFDKKIIQKNFSRGAGRYDEAAVVQKEAAEELCELVTKWTPQQVRGDKAGRNLSPLSPRTRCRVQKILDLGSGTSFIAKKLLTYDKWRSEASNLQFAQQRNKKNSKYLRLTPYDSKIFELDLSTEMLQSWHDRPSNVFPIQGDIENPPFENHSFDLIISSFSLQWIEDFEKNFSKIFSLLKPKGTFAFCIPTFESLPELREENIFNLNDLPKIEDLKSALKKSGFVEVFFQRKIVKQNFENGYEALKSLKEIGANYSKKKEKKITKTQLKHFRLKNFQQENKNPYSLTWIEAYFILKCSEKF
jgi:malonyl-CoA O-methyltransferase